MTSGSSADSSVFIFYGNSLTTLPPSLFHGLVRLEQLVLNSNPLRELPPGLFRGLGSLEGLWLNGNRLAALTRWHLQLGWPSSTICPLRKTR